MQKIYEEKMEQYEFRWNELMEELSKLWDKCSIPEEERQFDSKFDAAS